MANDNEKVSDVCDDIECLQGSGSGGGAVELFGEEVDTRELSERILSAHNRELAEKDAEIASHKRCYHALEVHCKQLEDEYLKATEALKPVLACNEESCRAFGDHYLMLDNSVREAQRVMREGSAK